MNFTRTHTEFRVDPVIQLCYWRNGQRILAFQGSLAACLKWNQKARRLGKRTRNNLFIEDALRPARKVSPGGRPRKRTA